MPPWWRSWIRASGALSKTLKQQGQLDNTLIFFLQDNGGCAEEHGSRGAEKPDLSKPVKLRPMGPDELQTRMQPAVARDGRPVRTGKGVMPGPADTYIAYGKGWANASNTPFQRYKHWVHEGGISTPLIVHWPAQVSDRGALRQQPGHLIDIHGHLRGCWRGSLSCRTPEPADSSHGRMQDIRVRGSGCSGTGFR